jgi:hypothetical protein
MTRENEPPDDVDIDACTSCGRYYGWPSVQDIADANPAMRPFPQRCRKCLADIDGLTLPAPYPFCRTPAECAGKGYCPKEIACND